MKRIILCVLCLLIPKFVQATPVAVDFTGVRAQLFDTPGYSEEAHGAGGSICFGGFPAMNVRGGAMQFVVSTKTVITHILSDFSIYDLGGSSVGSTYAFMADFTFVLYGQTIFHEYWGTIPYIGSEIKRSDVIRLYGDGMHENISSEFLDLWLDPGLYRLGIEGDPSRGLCYSSNPQIFGYTQVPEPTTMILFSVGLLFV